MASDVYRRSRIPMTRNLKVLMAAAFALAAFGVLSASAAQAAEFHCATHPCRGTLKPDGAVGSKTAHHVFIINGDTSAGVPSSISSTCNEISGESTSETETTTSQKFENIKYTGCTFIGQPATVSMNGCTYTFTSAGQVTITCPGTNKIEIKIETGCTATIGSQGPLNGISYHTIGAGTTREITAEALVKGITATLDGTPEKCGGIATVTSAEYTTGNTIITGETDPGGVHVATWYE
jgi:hypothetical protein